MKITNASMLAIMAIASIEASAAERDLKCHLTFESKQWSVLYQEAQGSGTVSCKDGSSMLVTIAAKGIGITAGKWKITHGSGTFTKVRSLDDVLGTYASLSADAGLSKAATAQALTKGNVSLALAGTGSGFDVGLAVSGFRLSKKEAESNAAK